VVQYFRLLSKNLQSNLGLSLHQNRQGLPGPTLSAAGYGITFEAEFDYERKSIALLATVSACSFEAAREPAGLSRTDLL
jgi:hypothetical protein